MSRYILLRSILSYTLIPNRLDKSLGVTPGMLTEFRQILICQITLRQLYNNNIN